MLNKPRVSIGMPLYNAEKYLERALSAILSQSFSDFELIISDNASTDRTWEICTAYASRDERIKLYRNEKNMGASYNFMRVLELATADYFVWASYDDLWEAEFLEQCVMALDKNPSAVLAFPSIQRHYIDDDYILPLQLNFAKHFAKPWERIIYFLQQRPIETVMIYGLYRLSLIKTILPFPDGYAPDSIWLLKIIQLGEFVQVEPFLFTQTHVGKRDIRTRLNQFTGHRTGIHRLLRLDWDFLKQLLQLVQESAPSFHMCLQLWWIAWVYFYHYTGWPLSFRLIIRYGSLLLPERLYKWFLTTRQRQYPELVDQ